MKKSMGGKPLVYPTPVWVVGSYDQDGKPNVMTAAWGGICCSKPPAVSVSLRQATYSYGNIMSRRAFTVNVPGTDQAAWADFFGIASGRNTDKFAVSGLTPVASELVDAPYIQEFKMVLECKLLQTADLGLHTQFIGEIMDVKVEESALDDDGLPDMALVAPFVYSPESRNYFRVGEKIGKAFDMGRKVG